MTKARTCRASGVASHATPGFGLIGRGAPRLDPFIAFVALRSGFGLALHILVRPLQGPKSRKRTPVRPVHPSHRREGARRPDDDGWWRDVLHDPRAGAPKQHY